MSPGKRFSPSGSCCVCGAPTLMGPAAWRSIPCIPCQVAEREALAALADSLGAALRRHDVTEAGRLRRALLDELRGLPVRPRGAE